MRIIIGLLMILFLGVGLFSLGKNQECHLSKGEQLINNILAETAHTIKNKYNLIPCGMGVAMPGGPIQEITLCFDTKEPYTKEQLRALLIKSAQESVNQVNKNPEIQECLKERPFTIKNVNIIIYNYGKNKETLFSPQIATARISDATLIYKENDPEDIFKYINRSEETCEEALKAMSSS